MNEKKFCFISCVNNKQYYDECLFYISKLNIPEGYTVETIEIKDAVSMTSGYNRAMSMTDAKYKIYLHQDTFILYEDFLYVILDIFKNSSVGMIGAVGSKTISTDGDWHSTENIYGNCYCNDNLEIKAIKSLEQSKQEYVELKTIDGFIMITQYDISWREDIFDNWYYYDYSQSIEFIKAGYKVVTPNIDKTWVMHDCGLVNSDLMNDYYKYNKVFVKEYGDYLFPLVSILIPSYNRPELFKIALESAINQTYENIEIIICDDSTNNKIEELMRDYLNKYDNIIYYHNEKNLGQFDNDLKLMKLAKGKYINFLMDDDVFDSNKIKKMMDVFLNDVDGDIGIVTSNRKVIDEHGNYKGDFVTSEVMNKFSNKKVDGKRLMEFVILCNYNIIGEPTTALFNKEKMTENFGYCNGRRYICNVDQATWLNILKKSSIVMLEESLSSFRISENQQLASKDMVIGGAKDYISMTLDSKKEGLFNNDVKYYRVLCNCSKYVEGVVEKGNYDAELLSLQEKLFEEINKVAVELPLVSIMIPTHNRPEYLDIALDSAVNQTYPNIEIIISDNSDDTKTKELVEEKYLPLYDNINYSFSKGETAQYNIDTLFSKSNGEYINVLMDDDVLNYTKIEKMMECYLEDDSISLVTSYRRLIDENGNFIPDQGFNSPIVDKDTTIPGDSVGKLFFSTLANFIGEPSTTLIKVSMLDNNGHNGNKGYYCYKGNRYIINGDIAMWLECCTKGNIRYIREPLSCFRIHEGQDQKGNDSKLIGLIELYELINQSYKTKNFINKDAFFNSLKLWIKIVKSVEIKSKNVELKTRYFNYIKEAKEKIRELEIEFLT